MNAATLWPPLTSIALAAITLETMSEKSVVASTAEAALRIIQIN